MDLYELNQTAMKTFPVMPDALIEMCKQRIADYATRTNNDYYMLLCKERNHYTIFNKLNININLDKIEDIVVEIAQNHGKILSIDPIEDNSAIEIWVRDNEEKAFVFMFFAYDAGVEKCR